MPSVFATIVKREPELYYIFSIVSLTHTNVLIQSNSYLLSGAVPSWVSLSVDPLPLGEPNKQ